MTEEETVKEKLDRLIDALDKQEEKKFKLPLGIRMNKGKLRKGFVIVQIVRTTGQVDFKVVKVDNDAIDLGKKLPLYHEATAEHILHYRKYPLIIIPEWNIRPFSPRENYAKAVEAGTLTTAEKVIIAKIEGEQIKKKMAINWLWVLIIFAVLGCIVTGKQIGRAHV